MFLEPWVIIVKVLNLIISVVTRQDEGEWFSAVSYSSHQSAIQSFSKGSILIPVCTATLFSKKFSS